MLFWMFFVAISLVAQPVPANVAPAAIRADENDRDTREKLPQIIEALAIGPGSVIADIGAGYGYYAVRFSPVVGRAGRVYAEEIDEPLVQKLRTRIRAEKLKNVQAVLGTPDDPSLGESRFDAVLIADVYHEVDNPDGLLRHVKKALKPCGRLMIIEYLKPEMRSRTLAEQRKEHNIAPEFVEQDLKEAGFVVVQRVDPLGPGYDRIPTYYVLAISPER